MPLQKKPQISQDTRSSPVNVFPLRLWKSIANAWNTRYAGVLPFWWDNMPDVIPWFRFRRVLLLGWNVQLWPRSLRVDALTLFKEDHLSGHCLQLYHCFVLMIIAGCREKLSDLFYKCSVIQREMWIWKAVGSTIDSFVYSSTLHISKRIRWWNLSVQVNSEPGKF